MTFILKINAHLKQTSIISKRTIICEFEMGPCISISTMLFMNGCHFPITGSWHKQKDRPCNRRQTDTMLRIVPVIGKKTYNYIVNRCVFMVGENNTTRNVIVL